MSLNSGSLLAIRLQSFTLSTDIFSILLAVAVFCVSLVYFLHPKYDPREPPVLPHYIPYIGHILGLVRHGQRYFEILRLVIFRCLRLESFSELGMHGE